MARKFVALCLGCILLLCYDSTFAAETPEPLHSIQGDFTQETHVKILSQPLVSHGMFAFQAPQSLRWEYQDPLHSVMFMHNGSMEKLIEKNGNMIRDTGMGAGSMQVILPEISNWLDGRFQDNAVFTVARKDEQLFVLTPKDRGFQTMISSIELHLGRQKGMIDSVTIFEGSDTYTQLTFSHIVLNQEIPESSFNQQ